MKVKPLGERILIKPQEQDEKTKGGIFIPDQAKEKTNQGAVVAVGEGKDKPLPIKSGQVVLFDTYAGTEIKIDGVKHIILNFKDVLAVIE